MVINLITFASILHKQASVRSSHEVILTELEKYFTFNFNYILLRHEILLQLKLKLGRKLFEV